MKILISGGTGLIGRALTKRFLKNGHEVGILTRGPEKSDEGGRVKYFHWDTDSISALAPIIPDYDVVINLAGENIGSGLWTRDKKERIRKSRVQAGNGLAKAIFESRKKPKVFIQSSGVGFYGTSEKERYDENSPNGHDFLANIAYDWENSSVLLEETEVRRVIIRTGVVLDKSSGVLPLMSLPFKLFVGGPIGSGRQIISWIHLDDEVGAIEFCINNGSISGPVNLSSPNAVSNADFGKTLAKVIHRPYWFPTPAFLLKIILGEMSTLVLEGQRAYPQKLLESGFKFAYPDLFEALKHLYNK
jgi:hypothetical protein